VTAFRATLEELSEAGVLLHVVDISSRYALQQSKVVEETLDHLQLSGKPRIAALNKVDLLLPVVKARPRPMSPAISPRPPEQ